MDVLDDAPIELTYDELIFAICSERNVSRCELERFKDENIFDTYNLLE